MTCIAMQNGIILTDRQSTTTDRIPGKHSGYDQDIEYVTDGTDKLIIINRGADTYGVTPTEFVRAMAFSGDTEHVRSMLAMMQVTTLEGYCKLAGAADFAPFMASVSGFTQSGKVFHFRSQKGKPRFTLEEDDGDLHVYGSGNDTVYRLNHFSEGCVRTPLEAMVIAHQYDTGTGHSFDYFNTRTGTYQNCVILTDRQRAAVLRRIESRFKLRNTPVSRIKIGFRESEKDHYVRTLD